MTAGHTGPAGNTDVQDAGRLKRQARDTLNDYGVCAFFGTLIMSSRLMPSHMAKAAATKTEE